MRLLLLTCLMFAGFIACVEKNNIPSDIIPKDKMEKVLWDMLIADRFANQFVMKDSAKMDVKAESLNVFAQVFKTHNTTSQEFLKSYKYYMSRPDITKVIFDSISAKANRSRDSLLKTIQ